MMFLVVDIVGTRVLKRENIFSCSPQTPYKLLHFNVIHSVIKATFGFHCAEAILEGISNQYKQTNGNTVLSEINLQHCGQLKPHSFF